MAGRSRWVDRLRALLFGEASAPTTAFLRAQIEAEDRAREVAILRVEAAATATCMVLAVIVGLTALRPHPPIWAICSFGLSALYTGGLAAYFQRRSMPRWLPWLNVVMENTALASTILFSAQVGAVLAVTHEGNFFWPLIILISALRRRPVLCVASGLFGAGELLTLFFAFFQTPLAGLPYVTFHAMGFVFRAIVLVFAGLEGAVIAAHLNRKVEQTWAARRENDLFGKYHIHERIGSGGMAEVFRATYCPEGGFQRPVAIKILSVYANEPAAVAMFIREAELGALLIHPNVVQTLDVGKHGDTRFLAMEFVDGLSLHKLIRNHEGPLPLDAVTYLGLELTEALVYIHGRRGPSGEPLNLVHRDVNPPNILLSRAGEVKLADFGILRAMEQPAITGRGMMVGKPGFMSPEQLASNTVDARTDLFAVGCTLYEALTGAPTFDQELGTEMFRAINEGRFTPVRTLRGDTPRALGELISRLLAPDVRKRTASASDLREELVALAGPCGPVGNGARALRDAVKSTLERIGAGGGAQKVPPPLEVIQEARTIRE